MNNKWILFVLTLAAGVIIGAAIAWMLCNCCCKTSCCTQKCGIPSDTTGIRPISVQTANTYFKTYLTSFISVDTVKGIAINADQFAAMQLIANSDTSVHGFRIYMGMDSITPVRMVVGTGSPDKVRTIYVTTDENSGICPRVCDNESPIIEE